MAGRAVYDGRVVVALWTVQLATVVFVAGFTVWLTCNNDAIHDEQAGLRITATAILSPLLLYPLVVECRRYFQRSLTTAVYLRLQIIKTTLWMSLLYVLLATVSGVGEEGIRIFRDAATKLLLPFLASLVYSAVVYRRERIMQKKMSKLVEAVTAMRTDLKNDDGRRNEKSDNDDEKIPPR